MTTYNTDNCLRCGKASAENRHTYHYFTHIRVLEEIRGIDRITSTHQTRKLGTRTFSACNDCINIFYRRYKIAAALLNGLFVTEIIVWIIYYNQGTDFSDFIDYSFYGFLWALLIVIFTGAFAFLSLLTLFGFSFSGKQKKKFIMKFWLENWAFGIITKGFSDKKNLIVMEYSSSSGGLVGI